jgi:hypothetical protein
MITNLKQLDDISLAANLLAAAAMAEGVASLDSPQHIKNVMRSTFNLMVDKLSDLTIVDTMKVNMLALALDADFNVVRMQELADEHVKQLEDELRRRTGEDNASSQAN